MHWRLLSAASLMAASPSAAFAPSSSSIAGHNILPLHRPPSSSTHLNLNAFAPLDLDTANAVAASAPLLEHVINININSAPTSLFSSSSIDVASTASAGILSAENIKVAFSAATFFPQLPWLFLILLPNTGVTKKLLGGYEIVTLCCLIHFFIVAASIAQPDGTAPMAEFADVFDPSGDPQKAMVGMMQYPNFVSEEWSHVLTWDLFVGRWIWLDGLKRGIFTSHSVLLCNLIGPPGLLLHWATCILTGKGLPGNAVEEIEKNED